MQETRLVSPAKSIDLKCGPYILGSQGLRYPDETLEVYKVVISSVWVRKSIEPKIY